MSKRTRGFRMLGAEALIVFSAVVVGVAASPAPPEQDPPAAPQEDKNGGLKKGEKSDKGETKGAALVKLNVEVKAEGAPLPDALVLVKQAGVVDRNSSTNSTGMAHFSQVSRGKTTVQVTAPGFKPHTSEEELSGPEVNLLVTLCQQ